MSARGIPPVLALVRLLVPSLPRRKTHRSDAMDAAPWVALVPAR